MSLESSIDTPEIVLSPPRPSDVSDVRKDPTPFAEVHDAHSQTVDDDLEELTDADFEAQYGFERVKLLTDIRRTLLTLDNAQLQRIYGVVIELEGSEDA